MPRWAVAAVLLVIVSGACRRPAPTPAPTRCRDAVRAFADDAVTHCRAAYAETAGPREGGYLARALTTAGAPLAEVRAIAERIGDHPDGAEAWNALGDLYGAAGDQPSSVAAFHRALGNRAKTDHRGRARDAQGLFNQYQRADDLGRALVYAGIAYEEVKFVEDPIQRGYVLTGIGTLLLALGDIPTLETILLEARDVVDAKSPFYIHRRHLDAIVLLRRNRFQLARQALAEVVTLARAQGIDDYERFAQLNLVLAELAMGDVAAAARVLADATLPRAVTKDEELFEVLIRVRTALANSDNAAALQLLEKSGIDAPPAWQATLDSLRARALSRLGRTSEAEAASIRALEYVEQLRANVEIDSMKPGLLNDRRELFEDLFVSYVQQARTYDAFAIVQRMTARTLLDGLVTSDRATLATAAERARGLTLLARATRASVPSAPPDPRRVLADLGDRHVVTFFAATGSLWRIVTSQGTPPRIERAGSVGELAALAEALVANVEDKDAARALGERLFPPTSLPDRDAILYVALDEPIHHVPLAALDIDGNFLVRRHPIAIVPNAAVLARIAARPKRTGATSVLGDATNNLTGARTEATDVAHRLGVKAALGAAATRELVTTPDLRVLHLATHTKPTPLGTALVLADGTLTSGEIVDRGVAADLVVLASCASADPLDRNELGPLANAFLATGARTVVATRWTVDDAIAHRFAAAFYDADGVTSPVRATAAAQRRLIEEQVPVAAWAMFVALGSDH